MGIIWVVALATVFMAVAGRFYSRFIARTLGEDPARPTPAMRLADGRDYVPSPTPVVFAHHFAAIAGAGPIVGPVIALQYGWLPALLWVVLGGVLIGAVHDYLALYISTREDGLSVATIARRMLGEGVFIALTLFLIVMLALVCATFLNLSATALTSMLPFSRLDMSPTQTLFRVVGGKVVIGGIASTSVILITAAAPLIGWMYIRRKIAVWKCSIAAMAVCLASVYVGVYYPIALPEKLTLLGVSLSGGEVWKLLLSVYVLIAAGVPVWLFLQSRDFVNCHILYVGIGAMLVSLVVAGARTQGLADPIPALVSADNHPQILSQLEFIWPFMFITVACGAVSGFHSLCASGTTCKQIRNERATRRIGYWGMLLESFLALAVIGVMRLGTNWTNYLTDVCPKFLDKSAAGESNQVLAFAAAMGGVAHKAWGVPVAFGALAGMVLLEGFLVTTLDAAVRLTRYLFEEVWRTLLRRYDVFAAPVAAKDSHVALASGDDSPAGGDGIPFAPTDEQPASPACPIRTRGMFRLALLLLRQYWVNSGLAVGLMLAFALSGGAGVLWPIFATSNQLLAAMVLGLASLWLLRKGKRAWFAFIPALFMLITTATSLVALGIKYYSQWPKSQPLLLADVFLMAVTLYLVIAGVGAAVAHVRHPVILAEVEPVQVPVDE